MTGCIGCGGEVPDVDGPSHRYMLASPGCWAAFTELTIAGPVPSPHGALVTDAYAVQHPGVPNPQATQSVWVHLITLHLALERGWPSARLVDIRRHAADNSGGWRWLEPPASMGPLTVVDVATAETDSVGEAVRRWVDGAWAAWSTHHGAVRGTAAAQVVARLA